MVKALRWAALVAFLSLPVILFLGRPVRHTCPEPVTGPCDPLPPGPPAWTHTSFLAALWLAVMLLLLASVANYRASEDRP
jgi:hypothetical protein